MIDYFGGITKFLPFLNIVNGLYRNIRSGLLNKNQNQKEDIFDFEKKYKIKKEDIIDFVKNILLTIFNHLKYSGSKKQNNFHLYFNFYFYILNKIELFKDNSIKINKNEFSYKSNNLFNDNYFNSFICFLDYINDKDKEKEQIFKKHIEDFYLNFPKDINNNPNISFFGKTNNQLYRNLMKQLFVYNRLWSKQYLFFKNVLDCYKKENHEDLKIKYKRINYYTSNFQQPLIYPILEIKNYYPFIKNFNIDDNLYKNKSQILNYDFSLDKFNNNLNETLVKNYLDKNDINRSIKCCLIKKMYHIQGDLFFKSDSSNNWKILFYSVDDEHKEKCNKKDNSDLCYGSVFRCLEKERKKYICIHINEIMFVIIRVYYYRPSGLEIFTSNNKSYYFNFSNIMNPYNHILFNFFNEYFFKEIKVNDIAKSGGFSLLKNNHKIIGMYNPNYSDILYPLFKDDSFINLWNEKNNYYSNFDKLMIINLFSNRSFNDLNQYPIFPMLYNEIGENRIMNEPIGFQNSTDESKERMQLIKDSYMYAIQDEEDNEKFYFNLFYSNITYTCNYLIRIFPYSFIGIEYQGGGFDDPNRLFFSIKSTFYNTLNQRADLRELIPEMFYFPPLFYNINDLELKKISSGKEIDNVIIHNWDEENLKKYQFLRNMRSYLEKEEKLEEWIDLIFGVNKEFRVNEEGKKERYYSKNNNINFRDDPKLLNDEIIMQSYDFGVLPYQLFVQKFPKKLKLSNKNEKEICKLNKRKFNEDHIRCLMDKKESFICKGEKGINIEYFNIIKKDIEEKKIKEKEKASFFSFSSFTNWISYDNDEEELFNNLFYLFVGDVFGNLSVYKENKEKQNINIIDKDIYDNGVDKKILDKIDNKNYDLLRILTDHTSEIKYIDYNPRLNLLVDYALDGFINLYTMPTLKLVLSIQIKDFDNNKLINVVLISNPFPMICCVTSRNIIIFDINGKFINKVTIEKDTVDIKFCIDKNCGLFNDYISYIKNNDINEYIFDLFKGEK